MTQRNIEFLGKKLLTYNYSVMVVINCIWFDSWLITNIFNKNYKHIYNMSKFVFYKDNKWIDYIKHLKDNLFFFPNIVSASGVPLFGGGFLSLKAVVIGFCIT